VEGKRTEYRTYLRKQWLRARTTDRLGSSRTFVRIGGIMSGRLADEVRARRKHLKLRQQELADLAGVSERFVFALENGKPTVQLDKVLAVLNALGLHMELRPGADLEIR
jgi:HTH-type transcriptional regulator / antitoxin HipB